MTNPSNSSLPSDYIERVYAGVLGKIIGVYMGRPFEGADYKSLTERFGQVDYYVHEQCGVPLIVTDDDISGTFTFIRALEDYGCSLDITAAQIGQSWLNYIIENRTILWWGGLGVSTEHTAFLRLKNGINAPLSGAIATNGTVVAEQIGAQIFIDGWGMVAPGDPELAADLAKRAATVSHDGEAIYGAQVVAALVAAAFVEKDMGRLLDIASGVIPASSTIYTLIQRIREWHAAEKDWRVTREKIASTYGYDKFGGGCHMVPNHALIIHALLYGEGDFQKSLMIVNTCGWDTDCNAGNVGCIMGVRNGLAGLETGPDWRGPVADRLYLPTADGGNAVNDALRVTYRLANLGRRLAGQPPLSPKQGARYHFSLPGSVQGFLAEDSPLCRGVAEVGSGVTIAGAHALAVRYRHLAAGRAARAATGTFMAPASAADQGYGLLASPTLCSGQTVRARVEAAPHNSKAVQCGLYIRHYNEKDELTLLRCETKELTSGAEALFEWKMPDLGGYPIAEIGVEVTSQTRADGAVLLDYLTWEGAPEVALTKPAAGEMWKRAWVSGLDVFDATNSFDGAICTQNAGAGVVSQGTREWTDYTVSGLLNVHMAESAGIAARVQGMRRYYSLQISSRGTIELVKALDGLTVLASRPLQFVPDKDYLLRLRVEGNHIEGWLEGERIFSVEDAERPLTGGAAGIVVTEGRAQVREMLVTA